MRKMSRRQESIVILKYAFQGYSGNTIANHIIDGESFSPTTVYNTIKKYGFNERKTGAYQDGESRMLPSLKRFRRIDEDSLLDAIEGWISSDDCYGEDSIVRYFDSYFDERDNSRKSEPVRYASLDAIPINERDDSRKVAFDYYNSKPTKSSDSDYDKMARFFEDDTEEPSNNMNISGAIISLVAFIIIIALVVLVIKASGFILKILIGFLVFCIGVYVVAKIVNAIK